MCLVENNRPAETIGERGNCSSKRVSWQDEGLETISLQSTHIAITTHARDSFTKRFPAPKAPNALDEHLREQVRQSMFRAHSHVSGKAIFSNLYWEFVLAINTMDGGELEVVVISCWDPSQHERDNRNRKAKQYRRAREAREWRKECCNL